MTKYATCSYSVYRCRTNDYIVGRLFTLSEEVVMKSVIHEVTTSFTASQQRSFRLIDTLPEDFLSEADFNFSEEVLLELDF